jgi:hypothetical protein
LDEEEERTPTLGTQSAADVLLKPFRRTIPRTKYHHEQPLGLATSPSPAHRINGWVSLDVESYPPAVGSVRL